MAEIKEQKTGDLTKIVEENMNRLHELERRLHAVQGDIANLAGTAMGTMPSPGPVGPQPPEINGYTAAPWSFLQSSPFSSLYGLPVTPPTLAAYGLPGAPLLMPRAPPGPMYSVPPAQTSTANRSTRDLKDLPATPRVPEVNIIDQGEQFLLQVELPGVKKDDLDLTVTDRSITISAESRLDPGEGTLVVGEALAVEYRRTIPLPAACNTPQTKASLKDGFLTLKVPKREPTSGPRRIDVAYG